jgi:hypothetical protein
VESLVGGAFKLWWDGVYKSATGSVACGTGLTLSNQAFQHTQVHNHCQVIRHGAIPRRAIIIDSAEPASTYWAVEGPKENMKDGAGGPGAVMEVRL